VSFVKKGKELFVTPKVQFGVTKDHPHKPEDLEMKGGSNGADASSGAGNYQFPPCVCSLFLCACSPCHLTRAPPLYRFLTEPKESRFLQNVAKANESMVSPSARSPACLPPLLKLFVPTRCTSAASLHRPANVPPANVCTCSCARVCATTCNVCV
jgi:hypothetical protein